MLNKQIIFEEKSSQLSTNNTKTINTSNTNNFNNNNVTNTNNQHLNTNSNNNNNQSQQRLDRSTDGKWKICNFLYNLNIMSVKNLRIYVIMIAIYQVLISHVLLFMVLLGLTHAEEMIDILIVDIADQKEREEYYEMPMNSNGESMNQIRFNSASKLATGTLTLLYSGLLVATTYVLACLALLIGTMKFRSELMIPWLVLHMFGGIGIFFFAIFYADPYGYEITGGCKTLYWIIFITIIIFDISHWAVTYRFYQTLKQLKKLTKSATVSIPYQNAGSIVPYHYRKENMYLGDGGYKHMITENCNPNYVV